MSDHVLLVRRGHELSEVGESFFRFSTSALTLKELRAQALGLFYPCDVWWLDQLFAQEKGEAGRILQLRTSAAPGSFGKTWSEQQKLLSEGEFVPTTRDLIEGTIAYYWASGCERLFPPPRWVRCQDVSSYGHRVGVGFGPHGFFITDLFWDDEARWDLGLAVARKN